MALECNKCRGRWLGSYHYWKWRDKQGKSLPELPKAERADLPVADSQAAKLCPECGHILIRYPVGYEIDFQLDRCGNCGGVWFDKNEWEVLESRNLHDDVHKIFSAVWQAAVRKETHEKTMQEFYREKFGAADYQKIQEIKSWINNHRLSHELYAFLRESE